MDLCGFEVGPGQPLFLIAGPCVIEPGDVLPKVADALARIERDLGIPVGR